jgi:asparagine synthase (glutamine-hydrolysing)
MCGILAVISDKEAIEKEKIKTKDIKRETTKKLAVKQSELLQHRGPDFLGLHVTPDDACILVHRRLSIVDLVSGNQPLFSKDGQFAVICNGEIYNHTAFRDGGGTEKKGDIKDKTKKSEYDWMTKSDCEALLYLFQTAFSTDHGDDYFLKVDICKKLNQVNGIFAFVFVDQKRRKFLVARDHLGIIPLYFGYDEFGNVWIASEMKALMGRCVQFYQFRPGHFVYGSYDDHLVFNMFPWYEPEFYGATAFNKLTLTKTFHEPEFTILHSLVTNAVRQQMMTDVPFGILLSGGMDSSVIAACASKFALKRTEDPTGHSDAWWPKLHTFSIGLDGSPDLVNAAIVAKHLGTIHHEIKMTVAEGLNVLSDVIYSLETYDVTTIRAGTPMYLLAAKIKTFGIKMILSGEGSDEMFGSYLYFHKCPSPSEFFDETVRKLKDLYRYDCLRANKAMAAFGIETRVPFLDPDVLDYVMKINPKEKMCGKGSVDGIRIEKWILRKAFENDLPKDIVWRQKVQFSDGVGTLWIDSLKKYADEKVTDTMLKEAKVTFQKNTPTTKEAFLYRSIFDKHFPSKHAEKSVNISGPTVACSSAIAAKWDASWTSDPSGRAVLGISELK